MAIGKEIGDNLEFIANEIREYIPEGYEITICLERGAAWVELRRGSEPIEVSNQKGRTLLDQIANAMASAYINISAGK